MEATGLEDDLLPEGLPSALVALEPLPISALAQYAYCPRRCALIHLEGDWADNLFTERGKRTHENVDIPEGLMREGVRMERALPLWSERLGLVGKGDVVEFSDGVPYPVEYKVGKRWEKLSDRVQLCAQALCLEEMFGVAVPEGALFYKSSQRRQEVLFTPELRSETMTIISAVRQVLSQTRLPPPVADARCPNCSLIDTCMPEIPAALAVWLSAGKGEKRGL
ncbi:MAG: CRISPR-associated protein Cas4 [Truepera sp.]|nr:CRISPR-associated protein Cas4 [Truepera sp.]